MWDPTCKVAVIALAFRKPASLKAGKPSEVSCETICDGVAVPYMTKEMFPLLRELTDRSLLVSEHEVKRMVKALAVHQKLIVEGSGALALAAALSLDQATRGRTACLITGGSIDPVKLGAILNDDTL